ncbi:MAG: 3-phosphoshikimate 1-carboxyvinyltransferase [Pirellulales bacterium]
MKTAQPVPVSATNSTIRPPGSKSITNRALVCAALARGTSRLTGVLDSEDTTVMIEAWKQLGLQVHHDKELCQIDMDGCGGGLPNNQAKLFVANSGTTIRFLTAALAACPGRFELDGVARMRQRPIGDLLSALNQLGANVQSLNTENSACPPVLIESKGLQGGLARVAGNISSQFLSGLMMAAPMAQTPVTLEVLGELVSVPYVAMTASLMRSFGAVVNGSESGPYNIDTKYKYVGSDYEIEPDASAASYFWAAAAITGGRAFVEGLNRQSLQGDVRFCEVLKQMGCKVTYSADGTEVIAGDCLRGVDVDMADISDTVQTLAAVALFAEGSTTVRGVAHNRVKETDRISDLATELRKLGARVDEFDDGLTIHPPEKVNACSIDTYHDHRMAMSLALVGLRVPRIEICDPDCTSKTYPNYWQDLAKFTRSTIVVS